MVDAVLFEFDGVIADTHAARRRALLESLGEDGVMLTDAEYAERCASLPVRAAIRNAFALHGHPADDTAIELAAARAERRFAGSLEGGLLLAEGAYSLIDAFGAQARLGIVARGARREIDPTLALARLDDAFEFVIADEDAFPPKPAPAPYLAALERLMRRRAVVAGNVVALEDGPAGIRSAKAAGLRCAAVGPLAVHLAVDADALLPTLSGQTIASIDALTSGGRTIER